PVGSAPRETTAGAATGTILVVEDEHQVRNLTRAMLARHGYRILDAASPAEALEIAAEATVPIDLLLTDIVMPLMSGIDLAKAVAQVRPGIKVLFMSGYTDAAVVNQGMLTAETPFIQKPFTSAALVDRVQQVLGR